MQEDSDLEINNLPNRLTIFRVVLVPILVFTLYFSGDQGGLSDKTQEYFSWIAGVIFMVASFTDFLDGYIARKRNLVTVFGSFLDPIADKFLVISSLIMLMALDRLHAFIVIILILRELYMTSLRLLATYEELSVPVNQLGKWKTMTQMMGIPMLIVHQPFTYFPMPLLGSLLILSSCMLSVFSAFGYSAALVRKLKIKRQKTRSRKQEKKKWRKLKKKSLDDD